MNWDNVKLKELAGLDSDYLDQLQDEATTDTQKNYIKLIKHYRQLKTMPKEELTKNLLLHLKDINYAPKDFTHTDAHKTFYRNLLGEDNFNDILANDNHNSANHLQNIAHDHPFILPQHTIEQMILNQHPKKQKLYPSEVNTLFKQFPNSEILKNKNDVAKMQKEFGQHVYDELPVQDFYDKYLNDPNYNPKSVHEGVAQYFQDESNFIGENYSALEASNVNSDHLKAIIKNGGLPHLVKTAREHGTHDQHIFDQIALSGIPDHPHVKEFMNEIGSQHDNANIVKTILRKNLDENTIPELQKLVGNEEIKKQMPYILNKLGSQFSRNHNKEVLKQIGKDPELYDSFIQNLHHISTLKENPYYAGSHQIIHNLLNLDGLKAMDIHAPDSRLNERVDELQKELLHSHTLNPSNLDDILPLTEQAFHYDNRKLVAHTKQLVEGNVKNLYENNPEMFVKHFINNVQVADRLKDILSKISGQEKKTEYENAIDNKLLSFSHDGFFGHIFYNNGYEDLLKERGLLSHPEILKEIEDSQASIDDRHKFVQRNKEYLPESLVEKIKQKYDSENDPSNPNFNINKKTLNEKMEILKNYPQHTRSLLKNANAINLISAIGLRHGPNSSSEGETSNTTIDPLNEDLFNNKVHYNEYHELPLEAIKLLNEVKKHGGKMNANNARQIFKDDYPVNGKFVLQEDLEKHLDQKYPKRKYMHSLWENKYQRVNTTQKGNVWTPLMNDKEAEAVNTPTIYAGQQMYSSHPRSLDSLGWVRYHLDHKKKKVFVEEVQHDFYPIQEDAHLMDKDLLKTYNEELGKINEIHNKNTLPRTLLNHFMSFLHQKGIGHYEVKVATPEVLKEKRAFAGDPAPKVKQIYEEFPKKMGFKEDTINPNDPVDSGFHGMRAWVMNKHEDEKEPVTEPNPVQKSFFLKRKNNPQVFFQKCR